MTGAAGNPVLFSKLRSLGACVVLKPQTYRTSLRYDGISIALRESRFFGPSARLPSAALRAGRAGTARERRRGAGVGLRAEKPQTYETSLRYV